MQGSAIFVSIGAILLLLTFYVVFWTENFYLILISILTVLLYMPAGYFLFGKKRKTKIKIPIKLPGIFKVDKKHSEEIDKITTMTEDRLFELSSVFPFDLFPNKIIIGQKQVMLIYRQFFFTSQVYNFLIQDILTPVVSSSVFFSTLRIELGPGGFHQNPPSIKYLKKNEALKARRMIMGLIICMKEKIDLSGLSSREIAEKTEEIGRFKQT